MTLLDRESEEPQATYRPGFIQDLSLSLAHRHQPKARFMVMTAYFDESGTHGAESPATIVAGFGATVAQWTGCEKRLLRLFRDFDVENFHAKDFRGTKNDFKGWDRSQKAKFNSRFLQIVDTQLAFGASAILASDNYKRFYRDRPFDRKARPDSEYGLCFRTALIQAVMHSEPYADRWPLNVVMELGHKNHADALRVFEDVKAGVSLRFKPALGTISFAAKGDCLLLSVADSLAYSMFRVTAGYSKHPTNPIAVPTGPADPPYYVEKIPMRRVTLGKKDLQWFYRDHCGKQGRKPGGEWRLSQALS